MLVERYCAPLRDAGVDVAVLGCTHYVFARALFERALPGVRLVDTAEAIARQTARFVAAGRGAWPNGGESSRIVANAPAFVARAARLEQRLAAGARRASAQLGWLDLRVDVQDMHC